MIECLIVTKSEISMIAGIAGLSVILGVMTFCMYFVDQPITLAKRHFGIYACIFIMYCIFMLEIFALAYNKYYGVW